jgi:Mg2+/Co2+ transporter CorB
MNNSKIGNHALTCAEVLIGMLFLSFLGGCGYMIAITAVAFVMNR